MASRIGVFGGTFNPVHIGHLVMAQDALERFELDRVLFIPCATPPHKNHDDLADAVHRSTMLDLAVQDDLQFEVSNTEIERGGPSYTVDTLTAFREEEPDAEYYFIIGSDTLTELHSWRNIEHLLTLCEFITLARPGFDVNEVEADDLRLPEAETERLRRHVTQGHLIEVSSSDIRMRVAEGMSIRYLVPTDVEMYIAEHGLYTF